MPKKVLYAYVVGSRGDPLEVNTEESITISNLKTAVRNADEAKILAGIDFHLYFVKLADDDRHEADVEVAEFDLEAEADKQLRELNAKRKWLRTYHRMDKYPDLANMIGRTGVVSLLVERLGVSPSSIGGSNISPSSSADISHGKEHFSKKPRLDSADPNMTRLHALFWGAPETQRREIRKLRVPDLKTLKTTEEVTSFHVLELPDNTKFPFDGSKLLITDVYEKLWTLVERNGKEWENVIAGNWAIKHQSPYHADIIIGQPGIGKTVFLSYALVRRLQQKLITIYCASSIDAHVFTENGVRKVLLDTRIPELDKYPQSCALINISPRLTQPPDLFYPQSRQGRVVIASSPNNEHFGGFSKERRAHVYCIPTLNWRDLYFISLLDTGTDSGTIGDNEDMTGREDNIMTGTEDDTTGTDDDMTGLEDDMTGTDDDITGGTDDITGGIEANKHTQKLAAAYNIVGGIPRRCLTCFSSGSMKTEVEGIQNALNGINSTEDLIRSVSSAYPFHSKTSNKLVRIEPNSDDWTSWSLTFLTRYVSDLALARVATVNSFRLSQSIRDLLANTSSRGYGGNLFERAAHRKFLKGLRFQPKGLSKNSSTLVIDIPPNDTELSNFFHSLDVRASKGSQKVKPELLDKYLQPLSRIQESVDSVFLTADRTVFLQMTVKPTHPIKLHGLEALVNDLPAKAKANIHFVFVVPANDMATGDYKEQAIESALGTPRERIEKARGYPQYVYYLDTREFDA